MDYTGLPTEVEMKEMFLAFFRDHSAEAGRDMIEAIEDTIQLPTRVLNLIKTMALSVVEGDNAYPDCESVSTLFTTLAKNNGPLPPASEATIKALRDLRIEAMQRVPGASDVFLAQQIIDKDANVRAYLKRKRKPASEPSCSRRDPKRANVSHVDVPAGLDLVPTAEEMPTGASTCIDLPRPATNRPSQPGPAGAGVDRVSTCAREVIDLTED
jgi:hypothetical protein